MSLAYLHGGDLGLGMLIFLGVVLLLGILMFGIVFAYILKGFLHRGQRNKAAGDQRQERKI
jgi:hypothetical protein